jgi:hypothetical protein
MTADFPVLLDACVLANQRVTDLLLRLAETPRLSQRSGLKAVASCAENNILCPQFKGIYPFGNHRTP